MRRNLDHLAPTAPQERRRGAFTLIELMIVIVVIGILMGLVLPAVMSSFQKAKVSQVSTEIRGLEGAIAQFKQVYGIEPPSRMRLYETGAGWTTAASGTTLDPVTGASLSNEAERVRSVAFMNRIWPNYNFALSHDFDNSGTAAGFVTLYGPECLVFFLGGRPAGPTGGPYALTGFSKNPADPFAAAGGSESREGPYFEFKASQLHQSLNPGSGGALVYYDSLPGQTSPYVYASSYDGRGYQLADLYAKPQTMYLASPANLNLLNVYMVGSSAIAQKNKSFQIISPGPDTLYGNGGAFATTTSNHSLGDRRDYDNITNFHSGSLNK